jgi:dihydrofolate synthase/folylpolyglutamate synthase
MRSPLYRRGADFDLIKDPSGDHQKLLFIHGKIKLTVPLPAMPGEYQRDNLAAALCAFSLLYPDCFNDSRAIASALPAVRVPGRLQRLGTVPEILLDVGHNALAAEAVAAHLAKLDHGKGATTLCVLAMLADKSAEDVALAMQGVCGHWICAGLPGKRGQTGIALARRVLAVLPGADVQTATNVDDAMQAALARRGFDRILVFGSFVTIATAANWVRERMQHTS